MRKTDLVNEIWPLIRQRVEGMITGGVSVRGGSGIGGGTFEHSLSGVYHTGTLDWSKVNKTGSSLADLATRPHSSLTGITANDHHPEVHALVGGPHTASGLTAGWVVRATASTAFAWQQLQHSDLGGVTPNQHHNQIHNIVGSDHTITADQYSVVGATANNTLGVLPTTNDGATNVNTILRSSGAGNLRLSSLTTSLIDTASGNLTLTPASDVILSDNKALRSSTFVSGFAGSGFRLLRGTDAALELDRLIVRGTMSVYELVINQIRATNGSLFVSSSGKVDEVEIIPGEYLLTTDGDHGFAVGDLIRAQRFTGAGTYQSNMQVTALFSTTQYSATLTSGDAPAAGMEFVRLGSTSDANRRGAVYLTADDSDAPFIDITDGVASFADWAGADKTKVRLGKLSGISDPDLSPTGYGLYSTNAYLKGSLAAGNGNVIIDANGVSITATSSATYSSPNSLNWKTGSTLVGFISGYDISGENYLDISSRAIASKGSRVSISALAPSAGSFKSQINLDASRIGSSGTATITLDSGTAAGYASMAVEGGSLIELRATHLAFTMGGGERMRITSAGRVGIGTAEPGQKLEIYDTGANPQIALTVGSSAQTARLGADLTGTTGADFYIITKGDGVGSSEKVRVKGDGRVGIGTNTPATSALLDLSSTTGALLLSRLTTTQRNALTAANGMIIYNTTDSKIQARAGGAWVNLH
jgi:hypothetical protein